MLRHELLSKPKFEVTPRSMVKRPVECVDAGSAYSRANSRNLDNV